MHILILSWRDIKNPSAGGAEIFTHEISKRAVKQGHKITFLSGRFPNAKHRESEDKINIIRPTYFYPKNGLDYLRWPIFLYKLKQTYSQIQDQVDIVIDQVHGLPSFAPWYISKPVILFPLEVASEIWKLEVPFPGNLIGPFLERIYLKLFKNLPFITISSSTAKDLKAQGIKKVKVITPGIPKPPEKLLPKTKNPTFICLGRLTKMKRLTDSIKAFAILKEKYPKAKLHIVGRGTHLNELKNLTKTLGIKNAITFHGFISDKEKYRILSQSWALLSTSIREGWGLNVIEAASVTTPTIAYKIPGIIDTVVNNKTGLLTSMNNPPALAKLMNKLTNNKDLRSRLSTQAKKHSKQFSWEKATKQFITVLRLNLSPKKTKK